MDVTKRYFTTLISVACLAAGTPALAQPADAAAKAKSGQTEKGGAPGQPAAMAGPPVQRERAAPVPAAGVAVARLNRSRSRISPVAILPRR